MQVFISDIRACANREAEKVRVDKELGKIRKKFASNSSITGACFGNPLGPPPVLPFQIQETAVLGILRRSGGVLLLAEYDKKKYVWKLLYIFMLGYDVEFGHKQAADLISATK